MLHQFHVSTKLYQLELMCTDKVQNERRLSDHQILQVLTTSDTNPSKYSDKNQR